MNGATIDERNYYAESYIALIDAIIKETASIISEIKKSNGRGVRQWEIKKCKVLMD